MIVRVLIDQTYEYQLHDVSSVRVAINRACAQHDVAAKSRQKAGFQTPRTMSQLARSAGAVRIYAAIVKPTNTPDEPRPKARRRAVRRGPLRA